MPTSSLVSAIRRWFMLVTVLAGCASAADPETTTSTSPIEPDTDSGMDGSDASARESPDGDSSPTLSCASLEQQFWREVAPSLEYCRLCHVPEGIADNAAGRDYMLSDDASEDYENFRASSERVGENGSGLNRLLAMPSGQAGEHTGGVPWAKGSRVYESVASALSGFEDLCSD